MSNGTSVAVTSFIVCGGPAPSKAHFGLPADWPALKDMQINRIFCVALSTTAAFSTVSAQAQDGTVDLGTIVLSGGLTPIPDSAFGRASTVITETELEALDKRYVADVLRTVPGLAVSRTGSFGGLTQVRIRGNEANHTLVLIDGVEVNSVNQGEYDFGGLLTADIARIEVLRGAQSSIYGSNAIGGVISITTKRATELGFSGQVRADGGTDETFGGLLALRQGFERGGLSFSVAHRETGGFDISGEGGEDDGDINTTININGDYEIAPSIVVGGTLRSVSRKSDFDQFNFGAPTPEELVTDAPGDFTEVDELYGSLFAEIETFDGRLDNRFDASFADTDSRTFNDDLKTGDNSGRRYTLTYSGTVALDASTVDAAQQTLTFALQYEDERFKENDPSVVFDPGQLEERERSQVGYILEYRGSFDVGLDLQGSVRFDDNDGFENFTTWALGVSYLLPNDTTRLHASAATGVQNPTLIEQFGFFADFEGNPDLEPEQSRGFDLGVEQTFADGAGLIDVTYFREEVTDEITSVRDPVTGLSRPVNQDGTSDRQGVEVTGSYTFFDRFDASLAYTYLDATDPDGQVEVRRPKHELYLQGTYRLPNDRTSVTLGIQYVSGLFDLDFTSPSFGTERVELGDYTLVDVSFRHEINDRVTLIGSVTNLTDEDYEEVYGYATPGREAFLGLSATF
ncbi:MAG: TonB-dependent receptor [Pseudomonadota bacterium]